MNIDETAVVNPKSEIPKSMRVGTLNKEREKPEWMKEKKEETRKDSKIAKKLINTRFSNRRIIKSGGRATIRIPQSKFSSILNERNIYFK